MSNLELILSILSTLLFIYALIITTLNFIRNSGKLAVFPVIMTLSVDYPDIKDNVWRIVHVANIGRRPIVVEFVGIKLADAIEFTSLNSEDLPKRLEEGDSFDSRNIDKNIDLYKIQYCWARDSTGKTWKSKQNPFVRA